MKKVTITSENITQKQWWTDETKTTGAAGAVRVRGFLGDYEIRVTHAGKTAELGMSLPKGGRNVKVVVD